MEERKFIKIGNKKHYYTEKVEPITFNCPVKGVVTVDFPVKYLDPIQTDYEGFMLDIPLSHLIRQSEGTWN